MGNQVTRSGEDLISELPEIVRREQVGTNRLMKSWHCSLQGTPVLVKVYARPQGPQAAESEAGASLGRNVEALQDALKKFSQLGAARHLAAGARVIATPAAVYVVRPYLWSTLHDRLATHPFLTHPERVWACYQMAVAVAELHAAGLAHGDLKLENFLSVSWGWVVLCDPAPYKPAQLPHDDPSVFSNYYEKPRALRRCHIAPERFCGENVGRGTDAENEADATVAAAAAAAAGAGHSRESDVYALGSCMAELLLDGRSLFDLSATLRYRDGEHDPSPALANLPGGPALQGLVRRMVGRDPAGRPTAAEVVAELARDVLPRWVTAELDPALQGLLTLPPGEQVEALCANERFDAIIAAACEPGGFGPSGLVLLIRAICTVLRGAVTRAGRMLGLRRLTQAALAADDTARLEHAVPVVLECSRDSRPAVRVAAIQALVRIMAAVEALPEAQDGYWVDFIHPAVCLLSRDAQACVRAEFVGSLGALTREAMRLAAPCREVRARQVTDALKRDVLEALSIVEAGNSAVRRAIVSSLLEVSTALPVAPVRDAVLPAMLRLLSDQSDWMLRALVLRSLRSWCTTVAAAASPAVSATSPRPTDGRTARTAVDALALPCIDVGIRDSHPGTAAVAHQALADLAAAGAVGRHAACTRLPAVLHAARSGQGPVRWAAARAACAMMRSFDDVDRIAFAVPALEKVAEHTVHGVPESPEGLVDLLTRAANPRREEGPVARERVEATRLALQLLPGAWGRRTEVEANLYSTALGDGAARCVPGLSSHARALDAAGWQPGTPHQAAGELLLRGAQSEGSVRLIDGGRGDGAGADVRQVMEAAIGASGAGSRWRGRRQTRVVSRGVPGHRSEDPLYPRGVLYAHMGAHQQPINDLTVSREGGWAATASDDGAVTLWDCRNLAHDMPVAPVLVWKPEGEAEEGGLPPRRTTCRSLGARRFVAGSSTGCVHLVDADVGRTVRADPIRASDGRVLRAGDPKDSASVASGASRAIVRIEGAGGGAGSPSQLLVCGLASGAACAIDPRAPREAWRLNHPPSVGCLTAMCVGGEGGEPSWLATGSSHGHLSVWDLRMLSCATLSRRHPSGLAIVGLEVLRAQGGRSGARGVAGRVPEADQQRIGPMVYVSTPAPGEEVALWDVSGGSFVQVYRVCGVDEEWAPSGASASGPVVTPACLGEAGVGHGTASAPASRLSYVQGGAPRRCMARAMLSTVGGQLLTAGSDRTVRVWDTTRPERSYVMCAPYGDILDAAHIQLASQISRARPQRPAKPRTGPTQIWHVMRHQYRVRHHGRVAIVEEQLHYPDPAEALHILREAAGEPPEQGRIPHQGPWFTTTRERMRRMDHTCHQDAIAALGVVDDVGAQGTRFVLTAGRDGVLKAWK
ncbi:unnamed protein product [Pedinophyceae sp. YPF-701]|nr:unnamed protein product [Pedinophyceae sp. YPF-701]